MSNTKKFNKVMCLDYEGHELDEQYWYRIYNLCDERVVISSTDSKLESHLADTDCLLVKIAAKIDKEFIDNAPNLKYIGVLATGYGGVGTEYATKKGIVVCNIPDYATQGVAEITFGLIFNHIRDLERGFRQARQGNYSEFGFSGSEIRGKTFGVIGLGKIGTKVAEIAKAFGAEVQYWSRNRKAESEKKGIKYVEINDLLSTSDFISINLELNPKTEEFLNADKLKMVKNGAIVINLSPMELVDIEALSNHLRNNDFTFIFDHADEMSLEDLEKIKGYPNCIIQLPIGYTTDEARTVKQGTFLASIEDFLAGKPSNRVN